MLSTYKLSLELKYVTLTSMFFSLVISLPVFVVDTEEIREDLAQPIRCETAEADIRILRSEKAHAREQIMAGIQAIVPISMIYHLVKGTEDDQIKVATGEYDKMLIKKLLKLKLNVPCRKCLI